MRKIKIKTWKEKGVDGKEVEQSLVSVVSMLLATQKPENLPKGLDAFRILSRINKAFEKSSETGLVELEESEYSFLKKIIERDIPSIWGTNKDILESINFFIDAKEE